MRMTNDALLAYPQKCTILNYFNLVQIQDLGKGLGDSTIFFLQTLGRSNSVLQPQHEQFEFTAAVQGNDDGVGGLSVEIFAIAPQVIEYNRSVLLMQYFGAIETPLQPFANVYHQQFLCVYGHFYLVLGCIHHRMQLWSILYKTYKRIKEVLTKV